MWKWLEAPTSPHQAATGHPGLRKDRQGIVNLAAVVQLEG